MQIFLPEPDIRESLQALDNQRLGKQRVEAYQILAALHDPTYGWPHTSRVDEFKVGTTGKVIKIERGAAKWQL